MILRKITWRSLTITTAALALSALSTGCFNLGNQMNKSLTTTASSAPLTNVPAVSGNPTAAVVEASQILPTFANVTGITPSNSTKSVFTSNVGNFSVAGAAGDVNPPMMFSLANVAAQMCNDLITHEKSTSAGTRRFFGCVDFTQGPAQFSGTCLNTTAGIMARSFYGTDISAGELAAVQSGVTAIINGAAAGTSAATQTQQTALGLCTAMLSAMNGVTH